MSNISTDRRQKKTQAALRDAFRELLLAEGYDAMTVGSVTARADVGRSTFYEHYRTKDDLLRASIDAPFRVLAGLVDEEDAALPDLLRHFREHQQVARVLLGWPTRPVLATALAELIAGRLSVRQRRSSIPIDVIARQIGDMQLAVIESWIHSRPVLQEADASAALVVGTSALAKTLL